MSSRALAIASLLGAALVLGVALPGCGNADDLTTSFEQALGSGNWLLVLAIAFVAGLGTSLTPCVYPMIGITVSIFGASEAKTKLHAAGLSSMYVLGICALFTTLGLVFGLTGGVFGSFLASPWVIVPLAVLYLALASSMFGAFELNLPPALQNRLAQMGGLGPKGAFVLGLVNGLIAAPCTGPVLSALLAWIGATGNAGLGAASLFLYGVGLGLPTWFVGTFAVALPKSGRWLEWTKSVMGIGLLVMALWFLRELPRTFVATFELGDYVHRTPVFVGASLGLAFVGIALGAVHLSFHHATKLTIVRKALGIVLAAAGATGVVLWLGAPPELAPDARIAWLEDYDVAHAQARREGRPLLVDFGASWCGACGELDRNTFSDPRVVAEGRRFVAVRVDMSPGRDVERGRELLARYAQRGLPLVVMHTSEGSEGARVTSFIEAERMLRLMRTVR